ncbi:hypothetical protein P9112_012907 [Eukaryota sp. TZLM1-RC]
MFNCTLNGSYRYGTLTLDSGHLLSTPTLSLYAGPGNPPGLIQRDAKLSSNLSFSISYPHVWDRLEPLDIPKTSLSQFYSHNVPVVLTVADSMSTDIDSVSDDSLSIHTQSGRLKCTPKKYSDFINKWSPEVAILPADEFNLRSSNESTRRTVSSSQRTITWTSEFVDTITSKTLVLLPVSSKFVPELPSNKEFLFGFNLSVIDTKSSIKPNQIQSIWTNLPFQALRSATCLGAPDQLFDLIESGIDLISISFHVVTAKQGIALSFLDDSEPVPWINLYDSKFATDSSSLASSCELQCCTRHSRQYLHHLLKCHEMIGESLLLLHNANVMVTLMDNIRNSIVCGTFNDYKAKILKNLL